MSLAAYSRSLPSPTLTPPYFLDTLEFRCNMCSSIERISLNLLKIVKNFKNLNLKSGGAILDLYQQKCSSLDL